jgi:nucleoside-diphosphate-sugar epimerase
MQGKRILIVGCGKIGRRVAYELAKSNQVWSLKRSNEEANKELRFIAADVTDTEQLSSALERQLRDGVDFILYCLTPSERTETGYKNVYLKGLANTLQALPKIARLKRIFFISSTSVYHQDNYEWVNESSLTKPESFAGQVILQAETFLQASSSPSTIIRFSGIYGAGRNRLLKQVQDASESKTSLLSCQARITNRIHEDDCVGFILHLMTEAMLGKQLQSHYVATDSSPVDLNEVLLWIAEQLKIELPAPADIVNSRRSGNKKCRNKAMLDSGYTLKYPSYKEGYLKALTP